VTVAEAERPVRSPRLFALKALGLGTVLAISGFSLLVHLTMRQMEVKNVRPPSLYLVPARI
jgi:hypothetical protein